MPMKLRPCGAIMMMIRFDAHECSMNNKIHEKHTKCYKKTQYRLN